MQQHDKYTKLPGNSSNVVELEHTFIKQCMLLQLLTYIHWVSAQCMCRSLLSYAYCFKVRVTPECYQYIYQEQT